MNNMTIKSVPFYHLKVTTITFKETIILLTNRIENKIKTIHASLNANKLMVSEKNEIIKRIILKADIVNADGISILILAKFLSIKIKERVTGIDLMKEILSVAEVKGYSIYFLGSRVETLNKLATLLIKKYPNLIIAGYHNGYYEKKNELEILSSINNSNSDILFIGMASPYKEEFIDKYGDLLNCSLIMGVGGSFDVISGDIKRAPIIFQKLGLEWLIRTLQEPRRLFLRYLNNFFYVIKLVFLTFKTKKEYV